MRGLSLGRFLAMARKEWIQLRRDPRSMALAFLLPVGLLIFFGYAITWDVKDISLAVLDRDRSVRSRELIDAFRSSGYFTVTGWPEDEREGARQVRSGQARALLVVPAGFQADLAAGRAAPAQLVLDGADANTATIALGFADAIVARWSAHVALRGRTLTPAVVPEVRTWYNPTLESRNMIVPGLIAVIMMTIAAMLTALTIAREWERGTMEQLAATPVHRLEVIGGKLLPYLIIGVADVAVTAVAGVLIFGVPFRGSVLLLGALTVLFLVGALGLGIFISAAAKSQFLAMKIAMIATLLPAMLLSGFLFEIAAMPRPLQAVTFLVPARYFVVVTRGIFLKGVGVEALLSQCLFMLAFAVLGLTLAVRAFRKEIA